MHQINFCQYEKWVLKEEIFSREYFFNIDAYRCTCYSKNKYGGKFTADKEDVCPEETNEALLVVDYN